MPDNSDLLEKLTSARTTRRRFINRIGAAGLGVAGLGLLGANRSAAASASFMGDTDELDITDTNILNFALNTEYLEAEYYLRAVFGRGLSPDEITGTGMLGPVIGGEAVPFRSEDIRQFGEEIAMDEEAHVKFLRRVLGDDRVARPEIDLDRSFLELAIAAGLPESFDPFEDEISFLLGAFIFEDVGVTAYKGAARFIENKNILDSAAGILAVEAYHASNIRTTLFELNRLHDA